MCTILFHKPHCRHKNKLILAVPPSPITNKRKIDRNELMLYDVVGHGAFGAVRKGKWKSETDVAVKVVTDRSYIDLLTRKDFIREAKIMMQLHHPHLVTIYGMCIKKRPLYIVSEYMDQGSLLQYLLRNEKPFEKSVLLDICIQVCKGMAYLENKNYIHRHLTGKNCMVHTGKVVKVADFGFPRDDKYRPNSVPSVRWSSPEVISSKKFSTKSDVWSFGIVMWEIYNHGARIKWSSRPYRFRRDGQVTTYILSGNILTSPGGCGDTIYDIMRSCWSYGPQHRPSFKKLLSTLTRLDYNEIK